MSETKPTRLDYAPIRAPSASRLFWRAVAMAFGIILVVVAGVAATILWHDRQRVAMARQSAAAKDVEELDLALVFFCIDAKRYPTTAEGLNALIVRPSGVAGWKGPYTKRVPTDPWGRPYVYRNIAGGYRFLSVGPDGKEGTTDDIAAPPTPSPPATTQASPAGS